MRTRLLTLLVMLGAALPIAVRAQAWTALTSGVTNDLNNLACVDARTCYAVGGAPFIGGPGIIIKTTNGGDSWTTQSIPTTQPLRGISCSDASTCYAAGSGGTLLKTTNGGATWTALASGTTATFWDVWALSASTAIAVGDTGLLLRTTDGGGTWSGFRPTAFGPSEPTLLGISCRAPSTCWIGAQNGTVRRTTDSGATWTTSTVDTVAVSTVFPFTAETLWAAGSFVHVSKSTDGGATWTTRSVPPAGGYDGVAFGDATTGWIVGNGAIITTIDGGATWTVDAVPRATLFRDIQCFGLTPCYVVGDDGTILRRGTPSPPPQADLVAGDRSLTCPAGELGLEFAEYRYRIVVTNGGTAASGPFTVRIDGINGAGVAVGTPINRTISDLAAGASTIIEGQANVGLLNPTAAATVTVRVIADALGQVTESNEANNTATVTQTCATVASISPSPITALAISPAPVPTTSTSATPSLTAETTPAMTVAPTPTVAPPSTIATEPPTATASPGVTPPQEIVPAAPSPLVGERPVAAVPTAVEQPAAVTTVSPEEKRVMEEAARRLQLETIRADAPKVLLGIERFVQEKGIARSEALEAIAAEKIQAIAESTLPTLPTSKAAEVRGALTTFIAYGTEPTTKLGAGERAGVVNSYQTAFGKLPETQQDWEDVMKISVGRFPSQTSAEREVAAEATFQKIYFRSSDAVNPNDRAAISIIAYGLRPANRRLASEAVAIRSFKRVYKRAPSSAGDWDTVRCIAYSGARR